MYTHCTKVRTKHIKQLLVSYKQIKLKMYSNYCLSQSRKRTENRDWELIFIIMNIYDHLKV